MKRTKESSNHYIWGNECDAWTLFQSGNGIIKEERMPGNTEEQLHFHAHTEQFFYVLEGTATFLLDGKTMVLSQSEGLHVPKQAPHKIGNRSEKDLRFLVMSFPGTPEDRVNLS